MTKFGTIPNACYYLVDAEGDNIEAFIPGAKDFGLCEITIVSLDFPTDIEAINAAKDVVASLITKLNLDVIEQIEEFNPFYYPAHDQLAIYDEFYDVEEPYLRLKPFDRYGDYVLAKFEINKPTEEEIVEVNDEDDEDDKKNQLFAVRVLSHPFKISLDTIRQEKPTILYN